MDSPAFSIQGAADVHRGGNQRQVRESLREVSEGLPRQTDLLRVQAEVIRVSQHLFEGQSRFLEPAGARESLRQPERAHREGSLLAADSVG